MRGNITRRGKKSWRIKFDAGVDELTGKRKFALFTVRGTKREAQEELNRRLAAYHDGVHVEPAKTTLKEWLDQWFADKHDLSPKTRERYDQIIKLQIVPHLGAYPVQKLRPVQIQAWHSRLLREGGQKGGALSARTVGHCHRVLRKAMADAVKLELVSRNVVTALPPPKVDQQELDILTEADIAEVLQALRGRSLFPIVALALASGMRRGELLAVRWSDIDLDGGKLRVERSLEETAAGLRFKEPKSSKGRRTITLPASTVEMLRKHRTEQLRDRLRHGKGKPAEPALVFPCPRTGGPMSPNAVTRGWRRLVSELELSPVTFHALRHSHASALIAAGVDVVTVSRRLGHSNPSITLNVYAHLFTPHDKAASVIEDALGHLG